MFAKSGNSLNYTAPTATKGDEMEVDCLRNEFSAVQKRLQSDDVITHFSTASQPNLDNPNNMLMLHCSPIRWKKLLKVNRCKNTISG